MYKKKTPQMNIFEKPENFVMRHGLDPGNRWVRMAQMIPWDMIEEKYSKNFKDTPSSRPAKPARMAMGTLIIKQKYGLSDEETVEMIKENPYLQYFIGMESFSRKAPIESSVITHFRKRITPDMIADINDYITEKDDDGPPDEPGKDAGGSTGTEGEENTNKGTLILDATCVPSDIRFPTDVSLLNQGRIGLEQIIDKLHEKGFTDGKKPRTYRKVARKEYMTFARNRRPSGKVIRKAVKAQLGYIRRDLETIESIGTEGISAQLQEKLNVIQKLYEQQLYMYENNTHKVGNRIVSMAQPWVRPIVRGKAGSQVEFGAKLSVSVIDGYVRAEKLCWEAYNESRTLQETVEGYHERTGCYPQRILADKIYRTRENMSFCKERGIHMNGPRLGRPPKDQELYRQQKADERKEAGERNEVEGKFGTGKRAYGLDRLTARLQDTCETQIHLILLTMNLWKKMKSSFGYFFRMYYSLLLMRQGEVLG